MKNQRAWKIQLGTYVDGIFVDHRINTEVHRNYIIERNVYATYLHYPYVIYVN